MSLSIELVIEKLPSLTMKSITVQETRKANEYLGKGASGLLTKNDFHLQRLLLFPQFPYTKCVRVLDTMLVYRLSCTMKYINMLRATSMKKQYVKN